MYMTIREVIDAILAYHPNMGEYEAQTVDTVKIGEVDTECTGIVTTCAPTVEVIIKAAELGCNLLITHEPLFYSHMDSTDWLEECEHSVYLAKKKLLQDNKITVWRDHDHIHAHYPDGIFTGINKVLGWDAYTVGEVTGLDLRYEIPETTVRELAQDIKNKTHLNAVRVIGDLDAKCSKIGFGGHIMPPACDDGSFAKLFEELDVIIPGELVDWTAASYARDAAQLGIGKAIIEVGHFNHEENGMTYMPVWLRDLVDPSVPIYSVPAGDTYQYVF
jgi:putative NIF3 family GTP cyclohydrolase 1 type 2